VTAPVPGLWHELDFKAEGLVIIAGLDEAGRGSWAGPVVAGAVILPVGQPGLAEVLHGVRDSKDCTPRQRDKLLQVILRVARAASDGMASAYEIDWMGVVPATRLAMRRALEKLSIAPQALLIDYVRLLRVKLPQRNLVRGEDQSLSIAAASIVAKVTRDRYMIEQDTRYPGYGFAQHKGYGTPQHRAALAERGPCALHRRSFAPVRLRLIDDGML
jgi:ribonuclease HII